MNDQGGERMEVTKESVTTLRAEARHPPVVCEGCDPYNGDTTGEVSSTLGVNCGMSSGRTGVVELKSAGFCTEPSAKARDIGYEEERSPTLRTDVVPAVLAIENHPTDSRVRISDDGNVETLTSRMGTGGGNVPLLLKIRQGQTKGGMCVIGNYSVRRLTPMECARLQGFPDAWCADLETPNPTKEDLDFWRGVFKTYTDMTGTKMKTDAQIIKWLQTPHSDSAEYKMWGNGVALPCVVFVMSGIVWANKEEDADED